MPKAAKQSKKPAQKRPDRVEPKPREEEIRIRAYEIYVARGRTPGYEIDDWLRAESEMPPRK